MKLAKAMLSILARLEISTDENSPAGKMLKDFLLEAPNELEFSVSSSRAGLQKLQGACLPKAPVEIEGWIGDVADEIYRIGVLKHTTCGCGLSEENHIFSAFLSFLMGYMNAEFQPELEVLRSFLRLRFKECVSEIERFRPSDN